MLAALVGILTRFAYHWFAPSENPQIHVVLPAQLSALASNGQVLFDANCAACHGQNGGGTEAGPPLIHKIYEPAHHGDLAFMLAVQAGVRAHHWSFGDMPPQPQVTEDDVPAMVQYIREVQAANGVGR